jgi:prolyl-tRNA synthetase
VPGRDFPLDRVLDLRNVVEGDPCPRCGAPLGVTHGIEVGHVFKLGTKYSKAMGATFLDDNGLEVAVIMGCYGIGINRIVAAAVESSHDDNGIIWPPRLAPYDVLLVPLQLQNPAVMEAVESLEKRFIEAGYDVLTDDREQRPGFKFKDADLIGIPIRLTLTSRSLEKGGVEIKARRDTESYIVPVEEAVATVRRRIANLEDEISERGAKARPALG